MMGEDEYIEVFDVSLKVPNYELVKLLGSGTFGSAYLAKDTRDGSLVAIKYIEKTSMSRYMCREILIHRELQHPTVARFIELLLTPKYVAIVMEAADQGDLFDYVFEKKGLNETEAKWITYQLAQGLAYMHKRKTAHRDIKLENILLSGSRVKPTLKLCDFGFSKRAGIDSVCQTIAGTFTYIAPEILERDTNSYDGAKADVWAAGVTLYAMTNLEYPFEDQRDPMNNPITANRIINVRYSLPSTYPPDLCRILKGIFVQEPKERISSEQLAQVLSKYFPDDPIAAFDSDAGVCRQSEAEVKALLQSVSSINGDFDDLVSTSNSEETVELSVHELPLNEGDDEMLNDKFGDEFSKTLKSIRDIRLGQS